MGLLLVIAGVTGFYFVMLDFWERLPASDAPRLRRWLNLWTVKGFAVPLAIWMLFNSAVFDWAPPLMPWIEDAKLNGQWFDALEYSLKLGIFVIGSFWAAITTIWLLAAVGSSVEDAHRVRHTAILWSGFLLPLSATIVLCLGWRFAGFAAVIWLLPVAQRITSLPKSEKIAPIYSRAIAALHFDRHESAETLVLAELENCQEDFDGWMLLADLYANHFDDLPGAEKLIRDTCAHPATNPSQFAVAFHKLADWHLKISHDPGLARQALEEICRQYPQSHLDKMARLRIRQLPSTRQALEAQLTAAPIPLPRGHHDLEDASASAAGPTMSRTEAGSLARQEIDRLRKDPDDIPARERLARLFAIQLENADLALEQMDLLLSMPNPPAGKAAEWLATMAAWNLRYKQDTGTARKLLERLIRHYPNAPQAFSAQQRLAMMDMEAKLRAKV